MGETGGSVLFGSVLLVAVALWAGALVVHDLRSRRLPNHLTLPAVPVAWLLAVVCGQPWAVLGGVGWFLVCVLPGRVTPRWRVGGGDAKLALSLGVVPAAAGGVTALLLAVAGASLVTLVFALVPRGRAGGLPHGPGMLVATAVVTAVFTVAVT
ncbi:prepilin peptidase [Corynebacterium sp. AOP40-9SA-29]|uniref:prepilin peptidase n=1 Tax=Corynebacterium sp. AOP40-9SA-29 TaxID=3457677 RepID=UPI004034820B